MRVLIDTNIFIYREDDHVLPSNLQKLLKILNELNVEMLVHPKSIEEIKRDLNADRREIALSKIQTYSLLEQPPTPDSDMNFLNIVEPPSKLNDYVDNTLLYAVYKDAVVFLITEDRGVHKKAIRLNIKDRVLSLEDALGIFKKDIRKERVSHPPALKEESVHNLEINDPFFDSLKKEYEEFETWFKKIKQEGRKCWVHFKNDGLIGALLIYKVEDESIDSTPSLPAKNRLKISTFKVAYVGNKMGELFIKLSVEYSIKNGIDEMYLTHFTKPNDFLVELITEFGFNRVARNRRGEDIFIKELIPDNEKTGSLSPIEISKIYYPSFYDGTNIDKFIVPIRPEFHERLFIDYRGRQTRLPEHLGEFIVEGNTIKKAYLCHAKIKKISPGDILIFYRSVDSELTSIGVVDKIVSDTQDKDEIMKLVVKRTVYPLDEIEGMVEKPVMVILFTWHFHFTNPLKLRDLKIWGILKAAPQSIIGLDHEKYLKVKNRGGIDERFTVN